MAFSGKDFNITASDFGKDFTFGVSTASYQIEGACNKDGKGPSIWDNFTKIKGKIYKNQHGDIACNFYENYKQDILMMKSMNIQHYRFSLSWSRIIPNGVGEINQKGINFYKDIINFCLECGITPWVTLYHWDLPQVLQDTGGWVNRDILSWFEKYATICAKHFGDRVKHWMVLNEPMVFTGAGYFLGVHAPGKRGLKNFLPSIHHAVLCQAIGGRVLRKLVPDAVIGTTFSCSQVTSFSNKPRDIKAAEKADFLLNRLFIEPSLGMGYPFSKISVLNRLKKYIKDDDLKKAVFDFDFIGIQNYTREIVKHSYFVPYLGAKIVKASKRNVNRTIMDWEVYPKSIYNMISQFNQYDNIKKLIITENGAAFSDSLIDGKVEDIKRINYLQSYLKEVYKAKQDGLEVSGYFVWTLMDNFEWAEGYKPRFGLVYTDYESEKRYVKDSGLWYKNFLNR